MSLFKLDDRAVIKISGPDSFSFLQGLLTCDVMSLKTKEKKIIYGAFLNAKGKFISDVFVLRVDSELETVLYLDCLNARIEDILLKLKAFKLRSKITLEFKEGIHVYGSFDTNSYRLVDSVDAVDPRFADLGLRVYAEELLTCDQSLYRLYKKVCIQNFIAFGYEALVYEKSFIMEFGFEQWEAVSFSKGCYLGQELTASMYYRKLAKREVVWFKSDSFKDHELVGSDLILNDTSVGKVLNQEEDHILFHLYKTILEDVTNKAKIDAKTEILYFEAKLKIDKCSDLYINQVYRRISI